MSRSPKSDFNQNELRHYSRQMSMPQFGKKGQSKLKHAKIAVIGAGGLGAPVLQYLSAAGVGTIGIFDFDVVDESNLHRQVLFTVSDIGESKVNVAAKKLSDLNPHINLLPHQTQLTPENAVELLKDYDLVVDGSDNFLTRYIINDACLILDIPLVYGSIYRFEGQVTVFNHVVEDGIRGPDLRDLYPQQPDAGFIPDCNTAGVLGVLPGVIGSFQATEAIKIAAGIGEVLSGKLMVLNLLHMETQMIEFSLPEVKRTIDRSAVEKRLRSYSSDTDDIQKISAKALSKLMKNSESITLIDVRTPEEHQTFNIGGKLIPLAEIDDQIRQIDKQSKIVLYCQSGQRSAEAIRMLRERINAEQLFNLEGGMNAWMEME